MKIKEQIIKLHLKGKTGYSIVKEVYPNPTAGNYQYVYEVIREYKLKEKIKQLERS